MYVSAMNPHQRSLAKQNIEEPGNVTQNIMTKKIEGKRDWVGNHQSDLLNQFIFI